MIAAPFLFSMLMVTGALPGITAPLPNNERALLAALTNPGEIDQEARADEAHPAPIPTPTSPSVEIPTPAAAVLPAGELARIAQEKAEQARIALEAAHEARVAEDNERARRKAVRARVAQQKAAGVTAARKTVNKAPEQTAVNPESDRPEEIDTAIRMAVFAVVLALVLFGAAFFLKRIRSNQVEGKGGPSLTVLESLWIGKGQRLLLVRVGGQIVLLAATNSGVNSLAVLPNEPQISAPTPGVAIEHGFQSLVQDEMRNPTPAPVLSAEAPAPVTQEHVQKLIRRLNTL
jgi:flagellar biogenesis protein FliO